MASHDVAGRADLLDHGEGDQAEIKAHDDAALLVSDERYFSFSWNAL